MIDILTITLGREIYLKRLIQSFITNSGYADFDFKYYIIYQGSPTTSFTEFINALPIKGKLKLIINSGHVMSVGAVMNQFKLQSSSKLFWKLDDDAQLRSDNFMGHILSINEMKPQSVFSPYPVGLINNPGGVLSKEHSVAYSERMDTYYTFRKVHHVGGFARIMPTEFFKQMNFSDTHSEDTECSSWCNNNNKPMYYLENSLIVEHQESTLGQHARYGKAYFKDRF